MLCFLLAAHVRQEEKDDSDDQAGERNQVDVKLGQGLALSV